MGHIYGWAHRVAASEIPSLLAPFHGTLGAVLYRSSYTAALKSGRFLAFVGGKEDATYLVKIAQAGGRFDGAIFLDEINSRRPVKWYLPLYQEIKAILDPAGIPLFGPTISMVTESRLDAWLSLAHMDWPWITSFNEQAGPPVLCTDPGGTRRGIILDAISRPGLGPWLLSPHPQRFVWRGLPFWFQEHLVGTTAAWYARLASMPNVFGIGIWALRQTFDADGVTPQTQYGIYDPHGRLTSVGRGVMYGLRKAGVLKG